MTPLRGKTASCHIVRPRRRLQSRAGRDAAQPKFLHELSFLRARPISATAGSPRYALVSQLPGKQLYKYLWDDTSALRCRHAGKCRRSDFFFFLNNRRLLCNIKTNIVSVLRLILLLAYNIVIIISNRFIIRLIYCIVLYLLFCIYVHNTLKSSLCLGDGFTVRRIKCR